MDSKNVISSLFGVRRALIGAIHTGGLPGTPNAARGVDAIAEECAAEAQMYAAAGFHGVVIENTNDRPYLKGSVGPEIAAALAVIGYSVRRASGLPLGVQVLAAANQSALAVAHACGAHFVRVEGFVFAHVADEGLIESSAGELLRYRRMIGANDVLIFADIKKKHSAHGGRGFGGDSAGGGILSGGRRDRHGRIYGASGRSWRGAIGFSGRSKCRRSWALE
jgi:membrane complex biogenesis BtpA family protein